MSKLTESIRNATSKTKKLVSKKAAKKAATKSKAPKVAKPKSPKFALTSEFLSRSEKEFDGILKDKNAVGESYFAMLDRCKKFGADKLYKGVKDETGKYFKTFRESMKFVFGKSASTMFSDIRVAQKLLPVIGEKDLLKISKENRQHITELPPTLQGEDKVIEAAKELTAKEFELKFPAKKSPESKKAVKERQKGAEQFAINVSPGLRKRIEYTLSHGLRFYYPSVADGDYSESLRAKVLEAILEEWNQNHPDVAFDETEEQEAEAVTN